MVQQSELIQAINWETKSISRHMKKLSMKIEHDPELSKNELYNILKQGSKAPS